MLLKSQRQISHFWYLVWVFARSNYAKLRQLNKQTVVERYRSVLQDLNDSEVLIVFNLFELSRSCSKRINIFQLSQLIKLPMKSF